MRMRVDDNRGSALVVVLVVLAIALAVAAAVTMLALLDTRLAMSTRARAEGFAFAGASAELAGVALAGQPDWTAALTGVATTLWPRATRQPVVPGWQNLDLDRETESIQAESDAAAVWGANAPLWQLYAHGHPGDLFSAPLLPRGPYVIVWLADDEAEVDGEPGVDTNGVIEMRVDAFGWGPTRQSVRVTLRRLPHGVQWVSWRLPASRVGGE